MLACACSSDPDKKRASKKRASSAPAAPPPAFATLTVDEKVRAKAGKFAPAVKDAEGNPTKALPAGTSVQLFCEPIAPRPVGDTSTEGPEGLGGRWIGGVPVRERVEKGGKTTEWSKVLVSGLSPGFVRHSSLQMEAAS
jgi:hypothetical protein|eukprot:COSAG01_NODE_16190_length_1261_cov_1.457831_1_plen_139_part_00